MSYNRFSNTYSYKSMASEYNRIFEPSYQSTPFSSTFTQFSHTNFGLDNFSISSTPLFGSRFASLSNPNFSESDSHMDVSGTSQSRFSFRQPIMRPHDRLLNRNVNNCPSHFTAKQRKHWLKSGLKAQHNQQLIATLDHFNWPISNYDTPLYINHKTSPYHLQGMMHKIQHVRLFTLDMESDKPTRAFPHSTPALIQIQAIHDEKFSSVFLIEVQYLPHSSTSLFQLIRTLCTMIFSSVNIIMAWGEVVDELRPFERFNLFDLSQVINKINLQERFKEYWNSRHPHTSECLHRNQPMDDTADSDDVLICLVNSNDIDNDLNAPDTTADSNSCICPDVVRPYKNNSSLWALQKAIQLTFNKALDKAMTMNIWSCGIDLSLHTWRNFHDKNTRHSLTLYAINDLFASTQLYFHMTQSDSLSSNIQHSISLNSIQPIPVHDLPLFLILSDSHGKYFPPIVTTPTYKQITKSISGLQWINPGNHELCAYSLITSPEISSLLASCVGLLFVVGTNSLRTIMASQVIQQVEVIIDLIRAHHPHLQRRDHITITSTFPSFKISSLFPTHDLLLSNINVYNQLLKELSIHKQFNVLDLLVNSNHLSLDGLHLDVKHVPTVYEFINKYIYDFIYNKQQKSVRVKCRSTAAIARRNKRNHDKLRQRQIRQTVTRPIARVWTLKEIKPYLKSKNIKFNRLPTIRNHHLLIQFNHLVHQHEAESLLTDDDFNEQHYYNWILNKH